MLLCETCDKTVITREGTTICICKDRIPMVVIEDNKHTKHYGWYKEIQE